MRLFVLTLILCTHLAAQATNVPSNTLVTLVDDNAGGNDRIVFTDPVTHVQTSHTLPLQACSALGMPSANEMLVANDSGDGSDLYTISINNGVLAPPVFRTWVSTRVKRTCRLAPGVSALLTNHSVCTFDSSNNTLNTLCAGPIGGTLMDIERTAAGVLLLSDTAAGTHLAECAVNGSLLAATTYPAIQLPVSLMVLDANTLHVGSATPLGTVYAISFAADSSGGTGTVSTVSQNHPPALPMGHSSGQTRRGSSSSVIIITGTGPQATSVVIELDGGLLDFVIVD